MSFPETWQTHEFPARRITVKGRSAVDPDCLVGHFDGSDNPLWVIEFSGTVVGEAPNLKASKVVDLQKSA